MTNLALAELLERLADYADGSAWVNKNMVAKEARAVAGELRERAKVESDGR